MLQTEPKTGGQGLRDLTPNFQINFQVKYGDTFLGQ
jgi:hypothetical protein